MKHTHCLFLTPPTTQQEHMSCPIPNKKNLTDRELEILHLIAYEHTNLEIAEKLYISFHTVDTHRKSMYKKLNVKNTAGLIRRAFELGFLCVTNTGASVYEQEQTPVANDTSIKLIPSFN